MKFYTNLFISLMVLLISKSVLADVVTPNVSVTPAYTSQNAEYTISSQTGSQGNTGLLANQDTIIVLFNDSTTVPSSISPSLITVNNTTVNYVSVSGRRLAILTPTSIANKGGPFTVVIDSAANISNPFVAGNFRLRVATSKPSDITLVYSNNYSITQSTTTVSPAAVTPNPSIAGTAASYSIGFDLGAGGYLQAGSSTITIEFPTGTYIPGGALAGVTVNSTSANANALNDSVVITTPVTIENNGSVQVNFSSGAGLINPGSDGPYNLDIKTSSEPTFVSSDNYTISLAEQLSISAITSKPETVNESGVFEFEFYTGLFGPLTASSDTISVVFAQNTYLPSDISPANVLISSGGFSNSAYALAVENNDASDEDTVHIVTPINISGSASVSVSFGASAGYLNPSVAGNYVIGLYTNVEPTMVQSNPFSVFNTSTTVSQPVVTPGSTSIDTDTYYTVEFSLGYLGRLKPGESTITLTFESGYTLDTDNRNYDETRMSVGGGSYITVDTTLIFPNNTAKTIQITVPDSVFTQNSSSISIIVDGSGTDPIHNPIPSGNQYLGVKTSVEATNVNSVAYNIGGTAISVNTVTLLDETVNSTSQYTFNITLSTGLDGGDNDEIKIIFPQGTYIPTELDDADVTIDNRDAGSIAVDQSTRTLTATLANGSTPSGTIYVVVLSSAGVTNPSVPSTTFYKAILYTNLDESPQSSPVYSITGDATQVTVNSVSANPSVINAGSATYAFSITTSASGKIVGGAAAGSSTITFDFDSTIVPASISPSSVEINSIPSQDVAVLTSGLDGAVEVTLPIGLTVDNSTAYTVKFDTSAGLTNGATTGISNVGVRTSSDTTYNTGTLTLSASQSLSVTSVTTNPTTQNANAGYTVKFKTGSSGSLLAGADIWIIFPSQTELPASMSAGDLTVNSVNPSSAPVISDDTLFITIPNAIGNLVDVNVLINQAAGILNPTTVQSYTLEIGTDAENGPYTSPSYNITQTTTTVTSAAVTVTTPTPGPDTSPYTIDFSTGANGKLIAGTSSITITFNASTGVNQTNTVYNNTSITANGQATAVPTANISIDGQAVTLVIPTGINIGNNESVSVTIDGTTTPITNPDTDGEYTLQVKTSVETNNITSNAYTITSVAAVTGVTVAVNPTTANANAVYTINFQVQNALSGGSGTITVTFPSNTYIPSSISNSFITVANGNPSPGTAQPADGIVTNPSTGTVTITVQQNINPSDSVEVVVTAGAGIENPSSAGTYTLQAKTSAQPLNATSAGYSITATVTTIVNLQVLANPNTVSTVAEYTVTFTTGANGKLVSGTSTITLLFPDDATFTLGTPATSKVTVNSTNADAVILNTRTSTNPDTLIITVPSSVTIGNNTDVTVIISATAGLQNASTTTALTYGAYTSVETGEASYDYSLPVELTSFEVKSDYGRAILNWITESELENAYWIIERKELTKSEFEAINAGEMSIAQAGSQFEEISRVEGRGNTAARSEYTLVDSLVQVDDIYSYRLADVSYNGVMTFHAAVIVKVTAPRSFELMQNYPNPFNPNTTIEFRLPVVSDVKLKVFNILGQEVVTLVKGVKKAGYYKMEWNGRNRWDQQVASGIYLYLMIAKSTDGTSEFKKVNKMVLIK